MFEFQFSINFSIDGKKNSNYPYGDMDDETKARAVKLVRDFVAKCTDEELLAKLYIFDIYERE